MILTIIQNYSKKVNNFFFIILGVHFSPVVAEVNWGDDASTSTVTPDRESLYSLNSSSPEPMRSSPKGKLVKPKPQYPNSQAARRSVSHPDLSDSESKIYKREFIDSLQNLRNQDMSKSQPDVSRLKRRGEFVGWVVIFLLFDFFDIELN